MAGSHDSGCCDCCGPSTDRSNGNAERRQQHHQHNNQSRPHQQQRPALPPLPLQPVLPGPSPAAVPAPPQQPAPPNLRANLRVPPDLQNDNANNNNNNYGHNLAASHQNVAHYVNQVNLHLNLTNNNHQNLAQQPAPEQQQARHHVHLPQLASDFVYNNNNNHIYVNPHSYDTNTAASLTTTASHTATGSTAAAVSLHTTSTAAALGAAATASLPATGGDHENNNGTDVAIGGGDLTRQHTSTTLNTLNTYLFPCGADSAGTIGGITFNGSHSCDLDSDFSRMVAGSEGGSSTISPGLGFINKRRIKRLFGVGNGGNYNTALRRRSSHLVQFQTAALAAKKQQKMEREATVASANAAFYEQQKKKKEKKKTPGPPPQVRAQAGNQMDDPYMNRPRRKTHKSKDKDDPLQQQNPYEQKENFYDKYFCLYGLQ